MVQTKKKLGFRAWFYLRTGYAQYFAFIFAAINTLTVTYFLAIENYPFLYTPSFIVFFFRLLAVANAWELQLIPTR